LRKLVKNSHGSYKKIKCNLGSILKEKQKRVSFVVKKVKKNWGKVIPFMMLNQKL
jgi:hypothetical protein